jgi:glycosyltransferase involved in cell wall biosynthesis
VLLLIGDGPERAAVARLARSLAVDERVCLLGEQASPGRLLAQADLFLLPSETESFGLAALESLSCGVPVVACDVGGLPEVVRHGETGLLAKPGDPHSLAAAARELLRDDQRRAAFGRAARADVLARFRPEPAIARFEELFLRRLG